MNNRKNTILTIVILVLIVGAIAFVLTHSKGSSKYKPVTLSQDQKTKLEFDLKTAEDKVKAFPQNVDPNDKFLAYIELSRIQVELGKYQDALASLDKVAGGYQDNPHVWEQYGEIYWKMNDLQKAKDNMRRSLTMYGNNLQLWQDYVKVLREMKASDDDINATYAEGVNATNSQYLMVDYAKFLEQIGNKDAAIIYYQKAQQVDPDHKDDYQKEIDRLK